VVGTDTGAPTLIAVSANPSFLGPVVQGFKRVDSAAGEIEGPLHLFHFAAGTLQPQFDAMVQVLAAKLKDDLGDSVRGRMLLEGVALRQTDSSRAGIAGVAPEYWEIHTGGIPSAGAVYASIGGGWCPSSWDWCSRSPRAAGTAGARTEEEEERQNEKPLV
jgi:hypothetical protein